MKANHLRLVKTESASSSPFPDGWQVPEHTSQVFFPKRAKYSLIVPVLNESDRIRNFLKRLAPHLKSVDLVLVDGGSTDGSVSAEILKAAGARAFLVKTGKGGLSAQLRVALAFVMQEGYEGTVLVDGNNKDNPDAIPRFIEALDAGGDHVQGSRFIPGGVHENTPFSRWVGIRYLHAPLISWASNARYTDTTNGFKAYSRRMLLDPRVKPFRDIFSSYELHSYLAVRTGKIGLKVWEIPVERRYPSSGKVPTKIKKFSGPVNMLKILFKACFHKYDPKSET
jgi:dolichol-phosphate mannosyltransferase